MYKLYKCARHTLSYCFLLVRTVVEECTGNNIKRFSKINPLQHRSNAIFSGDVSTTDLLWLH